MNRKRNIRSVSALSYKGIRTLLVMVFVFVGIGGVLAVDPRPAYACSCAAADTDRYVAHADSVFAGTVVDRRESPAALNGSRSTADPVYYVFEVDQAWKGKAYETTTLWTEMGSSSCGSDFKMGERYLVFARQNGAMLKTGLCSGNEVYASGVEPAVVQKLGEPVEVQSGVSPGSPEGEWGIEPTKFSLFVWIIGTVAVLLIAALTYMRYRRRSHR